MISLPGVHNSKKVECCSLSPGFPVFPLKRKSSSLVDFFKSQVPISPVLFVPAASLDQPTVIPLDQTYSTGQLSRHNTASQPVPTLPLSGLVSGRVATRVPLSIRGQSWLRIEPRLPTPRRGGGGGRGPLVTGPLRRSYCPR